MHCSQHSPVRGLGSRCSPRTEGKKKTSSAQPSKKITSRCALGLPRSLARCSAQKNYGLPFDTLKRGPATWEHRSGAASDRRQDPATGKRQKKTPVQPYTDTHQINSASLLIAPCPTHHLPAPGRACIDLPALTTNQGESRQIGRAEGSLALRNLALRSTAQSTHTHILGSSSLSPSLAENSKIQAPGPAQA